jgi:hypothetical protein
VGAVERKRPRCDLGIGDAAVDAGVSLREQPLLRARTDVHADQTIGDAQRSLDRFRDAPANRGLGGQAVDDDVDVVLRVLREQDLLGEVADLAVDARAHETLAAVVLELLAVLALPIAHHRREDLDGCTRRQREDPIGHLLHGLARDGTVAPVAVGLSDPGVEEPQVVVDLGGGSDRGARVLAHGLLLDRDGGRQALDGVDVGLGHLLEKLARVGGERLDVAPLALGVEGIEGEGGLARSRESGDDDEAIARDPEVQILEVVLARSADADVGKRGGRGTGGGRRGVRH